MTNGKFKFGISGAIGAAVAASACCTIPLALVSIGVGGAWVSSLVALEPFRPLFIVLSVGLFGFAFIQSNKQNSESDCNCDEPMNPRTRNTLLSIGAFAALALIASPEFLPKPDASTAQSELPASGEVQFTETTLVVDGMTCETCTVTVHKALSQLDGVFEVLVTYEPALALVRYDAARVSVEDFELATSNAGYPASPINKAKLDGND